MAVSIKTLADLKRVLSQPGAQVMGLEIWHGGAHNPSFMETFRSWRVVAKVQTGDVALAKSADAPRHDWWWLSFGKASDWTFDGSDQAVKLVGGDPAKRCAYRFSISKEIA